jgi:glyoxylase-like metal-dependent hydrolase (beta-lactamase superfamily II)
MFDELADGVFRRRYESLDLNVGVVIGDSGVLVVDTRASHRQAMVLADELRSLTPLPVRWVVNTHWHWDHTFGNAVFPAAEIWGHELTGITLADRGEAMKDEAKAWLDEEMHPEIDEVAIVAPSHLFSDRASVDIGREVTLAYHGFAHTDSDVVVALGDADVTFFGDMIEEGAPPSFGDSHPAAWPVTLRLASQDLAGTIVPGHGDVVDPAFVTGQLEELTAVADIAERVVTGELILDEAAESGPYSADVMRTALLRAQALA